MKKIKNGIGEYFKNNFTCDLKAGFITSIVALPLAIAFAIASGVDPIIGLYTAIIGGLVASILAGSKFSITGPTGAMAVIVLIVIKDYGATGLLIAGVLAGIIQILFGVFRLGKAVSFIPLPVISGFTAGIGAIIFLGQIPNALGLNTSGNLIEIWKNLSYTNIISIGLVFMTILMLILLPLVLRKNKFLKNIPASIFPLIISVILVYILSLNTPTIGAIPKGLPSITFAPVTLELIKNILPSSLTIALLGSIEALLCAVVCDGMTQTKHNPNRELISQGIANVIVPIFGGIPVTAAIARSAVNIREGAKTRIAGIIHALFILLYMILLGSIIQFVPKAFLAGVLMVVAVKMINIHEFKTIFRISKMDTMVLITTFILTIFTDLVFAVQIGMVLAIVLLFYRMTQSMEVETKDSKRNTWAINEIEKEVKLKDSTGIYTIGGPFFFGAMSVFDQKITEHNDFKKKYLILRMENVPFIDSTGLTRLKDIVFRRQDEGKVVLFVDVTKRVHDKLFSDKEFSQRIGKELFFYGINNAVDYIKKNKK